MEENLRYEKEFGDMSLASSFNILLCDPAASLWYFEVLCDICGYVIWSYGTIKGKLNIAVWRIII